MDNKKIKILYLLPGGLYNSAGMERIISIKANYLAEKIGCDVSIVTTEQMGRPVFYPLSDKIHLYHLDIGIYMNFGKEKYIQKVCSRLLKVRKYRKALEQLLYELSPDITISTLGIDIDFLDKLNDGSIKLGELHFDSNFRLLMARKMYKSAIPIAVEKIRTALLKAKCRKLAKLIVLTHEEKNTWKNANNIEVIPNPLSYFPDKTATCTAKKAIAVGRLVYEKGFDLLIESWRMVYEKHPDWILTIIGSGDQKEFLLEMIANHGLSSVIEIQTPVKDIYTHLMEQSIMLFPSRCLEAFGIVLTEAMACGLPLVAFDAPCGPKDIITDGKNGFLVPTGNTGLFAEKICRLIESDELRQTMGKTARQMSFDYAEDQVMNLWVRLFDDITDENNCIIGN
jgi:glycosyltransferase involved in cell wall biosynthesis